MPRPRRPTRTKQVNLVSLVQRARPNPYNLHRRKIRPQATGFWNIHIPAEPTTSTAGKGADTVRTETSGSHLKLPISEEELPLCPGVTAPPSSNNGDLQALHCPRSSETPLRTIILHRNPHFDINGNTRSSLRLRLKNTRHDAAPIDMTDMDIKNSKPSKKKTRKIEPVSSSCYSWSAVSIKGSIYGAANTQGPAKTSCSSRENSKAPTKKIISFEEELEFESVVPTTTQTPFAVVMQAAATSSSTPETMQQAKRKDKDWLQPTVTVPHCPSLASILENVDLFITNNGDRGAVTS